MAYVMMAIPAELVPAVTKFVESQPGSTTRSGSPAATDGFVHGWDRETVRRAYRESADPMRKVLRFLAQNANQEVSAEEIAEAIGARFGWNTVAGMLGALGRRSANRYGRQMPMWEYRYDDQGRTLLRMPTKVAEAIEEAK